MAFTLTKVIDGESTSFTLQNILEILGDPTNDEINFDGEAYRISSFQDGGSTGSGGGGGSGVGTATTLVWHDQILYPDEVGQTAIPMEESIPEWTEILFTVNGVYYEMGTEESYHISGTTLHWHGSFDLDPTDKIRLRYQIAI